MHHDDEAKLVTTPTPEEFPPRRAQLDFDWRIELTEKTKAVLRQKIVDLLNPQRGLIAEPRVVIVMRPSTDPRDETILADVRDESGKRIGSARIEDNGAGHGYFVAND